MSATSPHKLGSLIYDLGTPATLIDLDPTENNSAIGKSMPTDAA